MSDGTNWDENFGGARAGTECGWRSNSSSMHGGNGAFGAPRPPWRASRFAWRGPPIRRNARGARHRFFAGRRPPLLPTPPRPPLLPTAPCAFRIRCPPSFNVQRMGWQSSQPVRFASSYYVGDYSAGQSRHSRGRRTDGYDNDLTQCDESPAGPEEATREQGPCDWRDPKRRASRTGYYDTDRPCEGHDSSGAYNELPDCRRPVQRKYTSSPSTSEGTSSATPVITRYSPLTSRSSDRTGDASSVQSTPQGTLARCIPSGPQHSCTLPTSNPVSETSSDVKLAKRTHDCSISYDAKSDSSGKRPRPDLRAGKFRGSSEERSSSASSGVPPQGRSYSGSTSSATEIYQYDQPSTSSEEERRSSSGSTSSATEIYQYDQPSHSSEVEHHSSRSSSSATEIYDVVVSEINSEEDAALDVKAIVSEPWTDSNDWAGITRRLPTAFIPPTTDVDAVASSSQPAHLFATTNHKADSGHSSVLLEAARVNAEAPGQASLVRASVQPGITVDTRTSAGAAPGTFGSAGTGTSGIPGANVPAWTAGLPSPSDSWGTGHRPALVQSTVIMPGAPPLQIPMYELKLASTSEAGTAHRFPVVDGLDGRRGALFELMTVSSLYVLNMIEDHVTRERVIQLYWEGRHSDTMEAYGARIRELAQAAVERQRDTWKGLICLPRKLASIEWLLPQPGSCAGARVRELYELDPSCSRRSSATPDCCTEEK